MKEIWAGKAFLPIGVDRNKVEVPQEEVLTISLHFDIQKLSYCKRMRVHKYFGMYQ